MATHPPRLETSVALYKLDNYCLYYMTAQELHNHISQLSNHARTMPGIPQILSVTIPTQHQLFLRFVRDSTHSIRSLDPETCALTTLYWYVHKHLLLCAGSDVLPRPVADGGGRVVPCALCEHRRSHQFIGPCCLCPLLVPRSEARVYTEAAMFMSASGVFAGKYVARCAKERCGYLGKSNFYSR